MRHATCVILGGGLAGLTLALQLRARLPSWPSPSWSATRHPVPEAAHKVGESSVEIGANYLDTVLGLSEHLRERQLKKFGFRFFFSEGQPDIDAVTELGASRYLHTPSYQLDRGILENFLAERARARHPRSSTGATVREVGWPKAARTRVRLSKLAAAEHELTRALAGRCLRPRRAAAPPARAADRQRPRRQRRLVPDRHADRYRRLVAATPPGTRAAITANAGCRPTTSWARATGSG